MRQCDTRFKVMSRDEAVWRVEQSRQRGWRVVFTNGCFDLLHLGHVRYLEAARSLGDLLVVGVNSDDSVRRLGKDPSRPVVPQGDRAQVLAALACVDIVVVFNEDTPLTLIERLRPDVLVKGGDYTPEAIVGRREVESWGGAVQVIPLVPDRSTTRLLNAIRGAGGHSPPPDDPSR